MLITTKQGRSDEAKININYSLSVAQVAKKINMLSPREYAEYRNITYVNTQLINGMTSFSPANVPYRGLLNEETGYYSKGPEDFDATDHTYWQDQIFRTTEQNGGNQGTTSLIPDSYRTDMGKRNLSV